MDAKGCNKGVCGASELGPLVPEGVQGSPLGGPLQRVHLHYEWGVCNAAFQKGAKTRTLPDEKILTVVGPQGVPAATCIAPSNADL